MKVTMNIECTPEEARTFFGLPDLQPMQERLLKDLEDRMRSNMQAMDPETIVRNWWPAGMQGLEQMQKMFWNQMQQTMSVAANMGGLGSSEEREPRRGKS